MFVCPRDDRAFSRCLENFPPGSEHHLPPPRPSLPSLGSEGTTASLEASKSSLFTPRRSYQRTELSSFPSIPFTASITVITVIKKQSKRNLFPVLKLLQMSRFHHLSMRRARYTQALRLCDAGERNGADHPSSSISSNVGLAGMNLTAQAAQYHVHSNELCSLKARQVLRALFTHCLGFGVMVSSVTPADPWEVPWGSWKPSGMLWGHALRKG